MDSASSSRRSSLTTGTPLGPDGNASDSQLPPAARANADGPQAGSGPTGVNVTLGTSHVYGSFVARRKAPVQTPVTVEISSPTQLPPSPTATLHSASSANLGGMGFPSSSIGTGLARTTSAVAIPSRKGSKFASFTNAVRNGAQRASAALSSAGHKQPKAEPITDEQAMALLGNRSSAFYLAFEPFCRENHIANDLALLAALDSMGTKGGATPDGIIAEFIDAAAPQQVNLGAALALEAKQGKFDAVRAAVLEGILRHSLQLFKKSPAAQPFFPAAYAAAQAAAAREDARSPEQVLDEVLTQRPDALIAFMDRKGLAPGAAIFLIEVSRVRGMSGGEDKIRGIKTACADLGWCDAVGAGEARARLQAEVAKIDDNQLPTAVPHALATPWLDLKLAANQYLLGVVMPRFMVEGADIGDVKTD